MTTPRALICKVLFLSITTFETPPVKSHKGVEKAYTQVKEGANIMKNNTSLCTVLTIVALLGCLGMTEAQEIQRAQPTQPILITPELHDELTKGGTVSNGASISSSAAAGSNAAVAGTVTGWNVVHATTCHVFFDGAITWLYVYPLEGGIWFTANPLFQNMIAPACQTGNYIAFYVFDISGLWNQVLTYTFK